MSEYDTSCLVKAFEGAINEKSALTAIANADQFDHILKQSTSKLNGETLRLANSFVTDIKNGQVDDIARKRMALVTAICHQRQLPLLVHSVDDFWEKLTEIDKEHQIRTPLYALYSRIETLKWYCSVMDDLQKTVAKDLPSPNIFETEKTVSPFDERYDRLYHALIRSETYRLAMAYNIIVILIHVFGMSADGVILDVLSQTFEFVTKAETRPVPGPEMPFRCQMYILLLAFLKNDEKQLKTKSDNMQMYVQRSGITTVKESKKAKVQNSRHCQMFLKSLKEDPMYQIYVNLAIDIKNSSIKKEKVLEHISEEMKVQYGTSSDHNHDIDETGVRSDILHLQIDPAQAQVQASVPCEMYLEKISNFDSDMDMMNDAMESVLVPQVLPITQLSTSVWHNNSQVTYLEQELVKSKLREDKLKAKFKRNCETLKTEYNRQLNSSIAFIEAKNAKEVKMFQEKWSTMAEQNLAVKCFEIEQLTRQVSELTLQLESTQRDKSRLLNTVTELHRENQRLLEGECIDCATLSAFVAQLRDEETYVRDQLPHTTRQLLREIEMDFANSSELQAEMDLDNFISQPHVQSDLRTASMQTNKLCASKISDIHSMKIINDRSLLDISDFCKGNGDDDSSFGSCFDDMYHDWIRSNSNMKSNLMDVGDQQSVTDTYTDTDSNPTSTAYRSKKSKGLESKKKKRRK